MSTTSSPVSSIVSIEDIDSVYDEDEDSISYVDVESLITDPDYEDPIHSNPYPFSSTSSSEIV